MPKYYTKARLSEHIAETPEGFLLCIGVPITRTGEFLYGEGETPLDTDDDGTILISRTADDIFHPNCIASFEGKPATINHPTDFVTPKTFKDLAKGHMQNVRPSPEKIEVDGKQEDALLADLIIQDHMAIQLVKNGLREVSLGYEAEYEQIGEGKGRQFNIRGNHIALVDKGRAGPKCAINDHEMKGKTTMSKIRDLLAKLSKVADEEMKEEKKEGAKDELPAKEDADKKDAAKDEEKPSLDALAEKFKDLASMMDELMKGKEEEKEEPSKDEDKEEKKDDAKDEGEASLEDRLKALETAVAKLLEAKSEDADEEESDFSEDEEKEDEAKDDDFEESSMTGDTAARAEILFPGIKKQKDIELVALKAAYTTREGKEVIDALTGGKPTFDSAEKCKTLFIAASEVLKASRGTGLEKTKNSKAFDGSETKDSGPMTAEKLNELNAKRYGLK